MSKLGTALFVTIATIAVVAAGFLLTGEAEARANIPPNPGGGGCWNASVETCSENDGTNCTGGWDLGWNVEMGSSQSQCLSQLNSMVNDAHSWGWLTQNAHCWWANACRS